MSSIHSPHGSEGALSDSIDRDNAPVARAASPPETEISSPHDIEPHSRVKTDSESGRIADLFSKAPAAIAIWCGPDHVFELANPRYERLVGRKNLVGHTLREILPELEGQSLLEVFDLVYRTGEPYFASEMVVALDRDGSGRHADGVFSFNLEPILESGSVVGLMAVAIEVTEQVHARRAALESEHRLRLAVESAEIGIWDFDPVSGNLDWDSRCKAQLGLSPDAHIDNDVFVASLHPEDRDRVTTATQRALDPAGTGEYEVEYRTVGALDSVERWTAAKGRTLFESGRAVRFIGTMRDITPRKSAERSLLLERKNAEEQRLTLLRREQTAEVHARQRAEGLTQELRRSEQRYRSLLDATAQTIWINNPEGEMRGEQPGWAALTGQSYEEYQGHGWTRAIHPQDRDRTVALFEAAVRTGGVFLCEHRVRRCDGEWRYFNASSAPVLEADGSIREWFGVHTDVTEKKRIEIDREQLIVALKRSNEDLDQFAYVTSHDLKAPLRGIANLSQWVEEDLADKISAEGREHMHLLRGRVHRLEALINGILSYSRAGRLRDKAEAVDLGQLFREVIELLAPPSNVVINVQPGLPTIEAERVPLQQVFMNLISNAVKYADRRDPRIFISCADTGEGYTFTVKDNGGGIAPEFHKRIWVIFQTLEARDKVEATGIGLSIVKKIVESRGGRVWIDSVLGAGASFHFLWPKRAKASP